MQMGEWKYLVEAGASLPLRQVWSRAVRPWLSLASRPAVSRHWITAIGYVVGRTDSLRVPCTWPRLTDPGQDTRYIVRMKSDADRSGRSPTKVAITAEPRAPVPLASKTSLPVALL